MELRTKRTRLVPFQPSDTALFLEINRAPFVRKYLWDDEIIDESLAVEILSTNKNHFENDRFGLWKIIDSATGDVVGYAGLWYFFDEDQPQLLYAIRETYSKKGFAMEAASEVIHYAFNELGFNYLIAATDKPHIDSQKVAERLGMKLIADKEMDGKPTLFFRLDKVNPL